MEPGVVFQCDVLGNAVQGDKLAVAHPFQLLLFVFQQQLRGAQPFKVLRHQTVEDAVVLFGGETAGVALRVADMFSQQVPHNLCVVAVHNGSEKCVLVLQFFLAVGDVALHHEECRQNHQGKHSDEAAKIEQQADQGARDEGNAGREEPTADDAEDSRDAEHSAVASPSAVGKTCSHSHHKGYVGGGEWQFVVGADDYQYRCQHQIDRCPHHIERCAAQYFGILGVETLPYGPAKPTWSDARNDRLGRLRRTHYGTRCLAGAEHLVALVLSAQAHLGLHHILGLLRGGQCHNHYHPGDGQIAKRRFLGFHQGVHHKCVGVGGSVLHPVLE